MFESCLRNLVKKEIPMSIMAAGISFLYVPYLYLPSNPKPPYLENCSNWRFGVVIFADARDIGYPIPLG